jgi:ADP-glucose pyrophosphorylase
MLCVIGEHLCPDLDTLISGIELAEEHFEHKFQKYVIPYLQDDKKQLKSYANFFRISYEELANDEKSFMQQKKIYQNQINYILEFQDANQNVVDNDKFFKNKELKTFIYTIE